MRQLALSLILVVSASGFNSRAPAQTCDPPIQACTAKLAPGRLGVYDDSISDLAYRSNPPELWVMEGPVPGFNSLTQSRVTVFSDDLQQSQQSFSVGFDQQVFGIAEVPDSHPFPGNFYVLTPGLLTNQGVQLDPQIGIMDQNGALIADPQGAFAPIVDSRTGQAPLGFFAAMDAHPTEQEIAILDDGRVADGVEGAYIYFVKPVAGGPYTVLRGPFRVEGAATYFGGGITYNSNDTVLVISQFGARFQGRIAMEYMRMSGAYTGRSVILDPVGAGFIPLASALTTGFVGRDPTLFVYNTLNDTIYAIPPDTQEEPGPVHSLSPECNLDADGRVHLTWSNQPGFSYDQIVVEENGVTVSVLNSSATEYITPSPVAGKYEFCLETRSGGDANALQSCCEGQSDQKLPFVPAQDPVGTRVDIDLLPGFAYPHFPLGMACPKQVARKEDFRLYVIGTYDNRVRVFDYRRQPIPAETIITDPPTVTVIQNQQFQNLAATGIALLDVTIQDQKVPMYALLDLDGPTGSAGGGLNPSASIHFLKSTVLPGNPTPRPAGALYQDIPTIDFSQVGQLGRVLISWDSDADNNLVALDVQLGLIMKLHYDSTAGTLQATQSVPVPLRDLTPFTTQTFPLGSVSVLPNGFYLVTGGDTFDSFISRAFLVTPLGADPNTSGLLTGYEEGLMAFSQFWTPDVLGVGLGPDVSYGLATTFFQKEGTGGKGVGALFYNLPEYFTTPRLYFTGNYAAGLTCAAAHPDLLAEQLVDLRTTVGTVSPLITDPLTPSFGGLLSQTDYQYHLFNPSIQDDMHVKLSVMLDGTEVAELGEKDLLIPPGRSVYRTAAGRAEKSIRFQVDNLGASNVEVRVLAGASGIKSAVVEPLFRRGDTDGSGKLDLTDAIVTLQFLFLGGEQPKCLDAADADDDGQLGLTDAIVTLNYMFLSAAKPPAPGPDTCGPDVNPDNLAPCVYTNC